MKKIISMLVCLALTFPFFTVCISGAKKVNYNTPVVVSLGDSFSSGESVQPYYGQNAHDKYTCEDWIAHRSTISWPGLLQYNGVPLRNSRAVNPTVAKKLTIDNESCKENGTWYFTAVSGAKTKDIISIRQTDGTWSGGQDKKVEIPLGRIVVTKKYTLNLQINCLETVQNEKQVDYVTMTIGGNDLGFTEVVTYGAIKSNYFINPSGIKDFIMQKLKSFWSPGSYGENIEVTYETVLKKAPAATLVIAGYPQLLEPLSEEEKDDWHIFNDTDRTVLNNAVIIANDYLQQIINKLNTDRIVFVDVQDGFKGHGAYSKDPYIHNIDLPTSQEIAGEFTSSGSFHPNEEGVRVYADAVQEALAEIDPGFAETYYDTNSELEVLDVNGELYDDYTINISGKEYKNIIGNLDFWGLWKKDYSKSLKVLKDDPVSLNLPKGNYTLTITDNLDKTKTISKPIKIRSGGENSTIQIPSNFGVIMSPEGTAGNYTDTDVLPDAVEFNGHWYKVIENSSVTSWEDAQKYCNNQNGYLATITSQEENNFLYNYITEEGYSGAYFGLSDDVSEGDWRWSNGEEADYTNWHRNEPNGESSSEDYAMFHYKYSDGTWNDGDFGNYTSDDVAFICEWGEYTVATENSSDKIPLRQTSDERDIVLVLDVSGSMAGTPMEETKKASSDFVSTILKEDASIGIVTYGDQSTKLSDFSTNETALKSIVDLIDDGGSTNIEAGLVEAHSMLSTSGAKKKIIVLMSDGEPNEGKVGDELVAYADSIKDDGIYIYTLGFFESLGGGKSSAQTLMEKIASDGCHYEVEDADNLVFFFGDIADQINGQKYIYIRIACPVDVTVTYKGETLCSDEGDLSTRTEFGSLTFEDNEKESEDGSDNRIKVLRLKDNGTDYDIKIEGTGRGRMNYTIGFMDETGEYSDLRKFTNIRITKRTEIITLAANSSSTILNVDEDGDGKYDIKYKAGKNEYGIEVDYTYIIYIAVAVAGTIIVLIIAIAIKKNFKRKVK